MVTPTFSHARKAAVGVLASGGGSTFEAAVTDVMEKDIPIEFPVVVCSKPPGEAGIYERVHELNKIYGLDMQAIYIGPKSHPERKQGRGLTDQESEAITAVMDNARVDIVACLGYMRIIRGILLERYGYDPTIHRTRYDARMINTHPGLLPETGDTHGEGASQRILDLGLPFTAHTMHMVAADIDAGPVISETKVTVLPGMDASALFKAVQKVEKRAIVPVLRGFLLEQAIYRRQSGLANPAAGVQE